MNTSPTSPQSPTSPAPAATTRRRKGRRITLRFAPDTEQILAAVERAAKREMRTTEQEIVYLLSRLLVKARAIARATSDALALKEGENPPPPPVESSSPFGEVVRTDSL